MRNALVASLTVSLVAALSVATFAFDTSKSGPAGGDAAIATAPKKIAALDKVAVIGASISAGFRLGENADPFADSKLQLAHIVGASLLMEHQPVVNAADQSFFFAPVKKSEKALATVKEAEPTMIVALDYLFWFGYGQKKEEQRTLDLDKGLAGLAQFTCPILLGDLPDMTLASNTPDPVFGKPLLAASAVPKPETLKALNAKVAAFAKEHKNVVLVPLADLTAKLQSDAEIEVRGNKYPKGSIDKLMQGDRLHTTLEGTCAVWVFALDTWLATQKDVASASLEFDVKKLVAKLSAKESDAIPAGAPADGTPDKTH
ncbi:MAG: hypothetical protein JNL28_17670 [Planctomycetes bacterium]|nr:hypothetical protein [Planctomycetota bacterium]